MGWSILEFIKILKNTYKISGVNAPIAKDASNNLKLDFNTDYFDTSTNNKLEPALKANACKPSHCIDIDANKDIYLKYNTDDFDIDTAANNYNLKLKNTYQTRKNPMV